MSSNNVFNACPREAIQQFSCVSESYVLSNLRKFAGKAVGSFGVFDGHGGSRAADYLKRNLLKISLGHSLSSSNPNVAIDEQTDQDYLEAEKNQHRRPHQGGVCVDEAVLFVACLESGGRGVVAFKVETAKWVRSAIPDSCNTLQLVENRGKVYLFTERERGEHCIYELEILTSTMWRWKNVIRVKTSDVRGLPVYPEQTCLGFRDGHGDSRAANVGKQEFFKFVRLLKGAGAMGIFQKTLFAMAVGCLPQRANAQQLTSNGNPVDVAAWLTSDIAKGALVTALFAGGLGAAFIWKRFFCSPPAFAVDAGLEASSDELGRRRIDLDSFYPRIEC